MKTIFKVLVFLFISTSYSQASFCDGWTDGFKEGYCYGTYGCVAPYAPPCAIPNIGNDSYQGGYNQGFVAGQNKKGNEEVKTTPNGGAYGQLRPLENNNIGQMVQNHIRENQSYNRNVRKSPKYKKIETFDSLVNKGILYHKFKLYSHCIEYYKSSKKYREYNDRLEYVAGDSYWKLYQQNKKRSYLKKSIKVLKISKDHGNIEAIELLNEIEGKNND